MPQISIIKKSNIQEARRFDAEFIKKIQESHKLRKESKELLEEAKRKVERGIEKEAGE